MTNPKNRVDPAAPALSGGPNGKPAPLPNGEKGSVVLVPIVMDLAAEMRKVLLHAGGYFDELGRLKEFVLNRQVAVIYCGRKGRDAAEQAAGTIEREFSPERVGTLDLTDVAGFPGDPKGFVPWWEEAGGMGECFGDGAGFVDLVGRKAKWRPPPRPFSAIGLDDDDQVGPDVEDPIGFVDPRAFHGVLGRLAQQTQSETEADPLAVLMHLLPFFGAWAGRGPYFVVSGTRHRLNLFEALVGASGVSRKGTAGDVAKAIWSMVDETFTRENIHDGLNSGAGLLYHLRDAGTRMVKQGKPFRDEGVTDKRRAFLEDELGTVLKSGHRESENLLDLLRKFWDGKEVIRSNTKDPTRVTDGHLALVGHCTVEDLKFNLSDLDKSNGTANRFEYLLCRRSKLLPRGGNVFDLLRDFLSAELQELREALEFARDVGEIRRDPSIDGIWEALYRDLNTIPPGRIGAFYVRAPTIIMRRAALFALADRSRLVQAPHVDASLAIWEHSVRTLRYIFPDDVDPQAEKLLAALDENPGGMTRRELLATFNNHLKAKALDALLEKLLVQSQIVASPPESRGGRPAVRYSRKRL
jgi:hypothetical protein